MTSPSGSDPRVDPLLASAAQSGPQPVYLVHGDVVLSEPAARRLAEGLADAAGCSLEVHRRPERLGFLLADLRTFSLFDPAKVVLVVDSAVFADQRAAADLVDAAAEVAPVDLDSGGDLSAREREAASRLLQTLRLFDVDPEAGEPAALLEDLPDWVFQGGDAFRSRRHGRGRGKRQVEQLREDLESLLAAARHAGLTGRDGSDLSELSQVLEEGLPENHTLVLAEGSVAEEHPLVVTLRQRKAFLAVGTIEEETRGAKRGTVRGLDLLAEELERQTGVGIRPDALQELARRTLRQDRDKSGRPVGIQSASTSRLAGEYRKLASLVPEGGEIDRALVGKATEDRGEEDAFKLLDAVGEGRGDEALERYRRMMSSSQDPVATRLSFFSLFADFCRTLSAVRGMMKVAGVPPGDRNYPRFKNRGAPALQGNLPGGASSPVAGIHPYRLHRAYLAASRLSDKTAAALPAWVLDAELRIKGDSGDPDVAVAHLMARVAGRA